MKRMKGHELPQRMSLLVSAVFSVLISLFSIGRKSHSQSTPLKCVEDFFLKIKNESMDFDAAYLLQLAAPQSASFQLSFFLNMH